MLNIRLNIDTSKLGAITRGTLEKQLPFATALALTNVAFEVRRDTQQRLPSWLKINKTKFFTSSVVVEKATKSNLVARVGFLERVQLIHMMEDVPVTRKQVRQMIAVPNNATRSKKGNITKANRPKALLEGGKAFQKTIGGVPGVWQYVNRKLSLIWAYEKETKYETKFTKFRDNAYSVIEKKMAKAMEDALVRAVQTAKR